MLIVGTAGGNATASVITVGTGGGNAPVLEGWIGTPDGNSLFFAAIDWDDVHGFSTGVNADVIMPITDTIALLVSVHTGAGAMFYVKNGGAPVTYSAPVSVTAGDALYWGAQTKGAYSATVQVYRSTGPTLIDTFEVTLPS